MKPEGIALVTGASRGIGRAIAMELAQRGFDVIASMRDPAAGKTFPSHVGKGTIVVRRLDVTKPETIEIPQILRVLVNNAGVELIRWRGSGWRRTSVLSDACVQLWLDTQMNKSYRLEHCKLTPSVAYKNT